MTTELQTVEMTAICGGAQDGYYLGEEFATVIGMAFVAGLIGSGGALGAAFIAGAFTLFDNGGFYQYW